MKYIILIILALSLQTSLAENKSELYKVIEIHKNDTLEFNVVLFERNDRIFHVHIEYTELANLSIEDFFKKDSCYDIDLDYPPSQFSGYPYTVSNNLDSLLRGRFLMTYSLDKLDDSTFIVYNITNLNDFIEDYIYNHIRKLNKVKELENRIKFPVIFTSKEVTTSTSLIYKVQVAVKNELRLQPIYNFEYHVESKRLSYYDPLEDKLINSTDWDNKVD